MVSNIKNSANGGTSPLGVPAAGAGDSKKAERAAGPAAAKTAAAAYAKAPAAPTASEAANVQISQRAREMNQMRKIVDETPDVREDKIAHFKDLIAKGQYKADAGKIADGLLNEAIKEELSKDSQPE